MDWSTVFDEAYPEPPATDEALAHLLADVGPPLPASYLSLLRWSDGGEFRVGQRWWQFLPASDPVHGVRALLLAYGLDVYMPGAVPIALNGHGTLYLLDRRRPAVDGEFPVVVARAGDLGWDEHRRVADTFVQACCGATHVDRLWDD